jgi:hypothetical protein
VKKGSSIKIISLFTLVLVLSSFKLHTYYVSVCSIDYNTSNKNIEVSLKFIAHDIEKAIDNEYGIDLNIGEPNQYVAIDSVLNLYIKDHFQLTTNNTVIHLELLGKEFNLDESFYVYYQAPQENKPSILSIDNSLLTSAFPGQENITHINFGTIQKSYSFNKINTHYTYNTDE